MAQSSDSPGEQKSAVEHATIEEHCAAAGTDLPTFNAAKAYHQWGALKRMPRADYDAAISKVANLKFQ